MSSYDYPLEASNSQRQLTAHIGTPAQKHALELVHTSQSAAESSIRGLEKRIDALQTVSLTSFLTFMIVQSTPVAISIAYKCNHIRSGPTKSYPRPAKRFAECFATPLAALTNLPIAG